MLKRKVQMAKTLKTVALAAAGALALAAAPASAAPFITFDGTNGTFGNDGLGASGPFLDVFNFTLTSAKKLSVVFTSTMTSNEDNVNFNFSAVTLNGVRLDLISRGVFEQRQIIDLVAAPGMQTLSILGAGGALGMYNGTIAAAAVPEPATWALAFLGFGLAGAAMRRRVRFAVRAAA
jgi:PEP-CTERM motif